MEKGRLNRAHVRRNLPRFAGVYGWALRPVRLSGGFRGRPPSASTGPQPGFWGPPMAAEGARCFGFRRGRRVRSHRVGPDLGPPRLSAGEGDGVVPTGFQRGPRGWVSRMGPQQEPPPVLNASPFPDLDRDDAWDLGVGRLATERQRPRQGVTRLRRVRERLRSTTGLQQSPTGAFAQPVTASGVTPPSGRLPATPEDGALGPVAAG